MAEIRRARRTRFLADENIEPWAIYVMRRNQLDVLEAKQVGLGQRDDRQVFAASWKLRRLLLTHDRDFLDDIRFPHNRCAGLIVLPDFGRQTLDFGTVVSRATRLVVKGADLWFGTKIVVSQDNTVTVRTWEKSEGRVNLWRTQFAGTR